MEVLCVNLCRRFRSHRCNTAVTQSGGKEEDVKKRHLKHLKSLQDHVTVVSGVHREVLAKYYLRGYSIGNEGPARRQALCWLQRR